MLQPRTLGADSSSVRRVLARLRAEEGFGIVELIVAMAMLNIGLLALMAAFVSGVTTTKRAGRVATASTLADTQMELYRALTYDPIALNPPLPTSAPYTTDPAYSPSQVTTTTGCGGSGTSAPQGGASQTGPGPDHGTYQIDTYIVCTTPTNGRPVKQVTVVVRDAQSLSGPALARRSSLFDASTGT
jgi:type II secretory pathway pseudopilin PulG